MSDLMIQFLVRFETLAMELAMSRSTAGRQHSIVLPSAQLPPSQPASKPVFKWIRDKIAPIVLTETEDSRLVAEGTPLVFDTPRLVGKQAATGRISKAALKNLPTGKVRLTLNEYNNFEHKDTGIVFDRTMAIGWQNADTGLVEDLTSEQIDFCKANKIRYSLAKTYEKELAERRAAIPPTVLDPDSSSSGEDEDE